MPPARHEPELTWRRCAGMDPSGDGVLDFDELRGHGARPGGRADARAGRLVRLPGARHRRLGKVNAAELRAAVIKVNPPDRRRHRGGDGALRQGQDGPITEKSSAGIELMKTFG